MSITSRTAITVRNALLISLAGALIACTLAVHPLLTLALGSLFLGPLLSDWLASRFSTHVVYMLRNDRHDVIYVGQTDDTARRMYQHTDGTEHTWWRDIYGYTVWRHCWSDRQSRRIERRLVGVVNRASEKNWCDKLLNEQYGEDHQKQARALTIRTWYLPYLLSSHMVDSRSYHSPCVASISIPSRPAADETDDEPDYADQWADDTSDREPVYEATYERRPPSASDTVTAPALPPVSCHTQGCDTHCHTTRSPEGGTTSDDSVTSHPGRHSHGGPDGASVRDAHRRQQAAVVADIPADLAAYLTGDEAGTITDLDADQLKKLKATLRQRKSRANRAAAAETGPTMTSRTRRPGGGVERGRG